MISSKLLTFADSLSFWATCFGFFPTGYFVSHNDFFPAASISNYL